ncbi:MAG: prepilin-type N-terminal cleavage/methylation domain-containing protein [Burkholderiaceae bacterium]|nr:type II secretion system GspH family protein [Aquabacterium sp.]NUP87505.1 prepilin-type N-terminal cleavage/methylation domain-containing protein [Burkholderiaceae bacterium]
MLRRGYTIIELLVVLAAIALLLSVAAPRYVRHLDTAREVALKRNLQVLRDSIDRFHADHERYPSGLGELVQRRYIRALPEDPLTSRHDTWVVVPASGNAGIYDVRSGATGRASDGSEFGAW